MILTFIFIGLIVLGCLFWIWYDRTNNYCLEDWLSILTGICMAIGSIGTFVILLAILITHINTDMQIYDNNVDYQRINYQIEAIKNEYEDLSSIEVIKDAVEWNAKVYRDNHYLNGKWLNWFYCRKVVEAKKYIDLEGLIK